MPLLQGYFRPKNPKKYRGDPTNIIYRSSWELKLMNRLDIDEQIISWSSEEVAIPYRSPFDNRIHRYFPDFLIMKINKEGKKETILLEVKPARQTRPPERQEKVTRKYLLEVKTWGINNSKWEAANDYCKDRGWKFMILTEKELGIKGF